MEYDPSSNKVMQFTYQLQNTASQKVQKQIFVCVWVFFFFFFLGGGGGL